MLSHKYRRDISRIILFGSLWFILSLLYAVLDKSIRGNLDY